MPETTDFAAIVSTLAEYGDAAGAAFFALIAAGADTRTPAERRASLVAMRDAHRAELAKGRVA